jgi:Spy/CpxP family protein refolding chaperone
MAPRRDPGARHAGTRLPASRRIDNFPDGPFEEAGMRIVTVALTFAVVASACSTDTMAPMDDSGAVTLEELAALGYGVTQVGAAGGAPGIIERLAQLPPDLALSGAQLAQIAALIDAFVAATAPGREALAAIREEAAAARSAGATPDEVRAILAAGQEIRQRLHEAELMLRRAIMGVLTPAQRAWLTNRPPPEPRPCALTEAQRTEMAGLRAAYEQENAADIALVRSVHDRARAAMQSGASRAEVAAILSEARAAVQRLRDARAALHEALQAVLTPEQRAAGCFR